MKLSTTAKHASNLTISIILIIITFITYINILPNKLFFDDEELIYKNSYVQNINNFPKYFTSNMIAGAGKISNMYRPVLTLSFAIDYFLWQGIPFGFHLTSIILHAAADVYPNTHHNLANAYVKLGKYKEAEKEYLAAIKMDPNFYFSYYALVDLYKKTEEKEKLNKLLEKIKL